MLMPRRVMAPVKCFAPLAWECVYVTYCVACITFHDFVLVYDYTTVIQMFIVYLICSHSPFIPFFVLFVSIFSWIWILPDQKINTFLRWLIVLCLYLQSRQGRTGNYLEDTDIYWTTWQMDYVIKQKIRFVWMCFTLWWGWWGFDGAMYTTCNDSYELG
jgi:hypothetical protein